MSQALNNEQDLALLVGRRGEKERPVTQRDMAWTKAWRCNSAWLVEEAGMWGGKVR